jgi:bacterioferritin
MQGDPQIIEALNEVLTAELTAINQYFAQGKMCRNWGYQKLAKRFRDESIDEMKDADRLIDRILYLDGVPNMQRLLPVQIGESPKEQLQAALATETEAIARLNRSVALARERGDNGTRDLLEEILGGEEESADWLEAQLHLIAEVGMERYLAEMIHE